MLSVVHIYLFIFSAVSFTAENPEQDLASAAFLCKGKFQLFSNTGQVVQLLKNIMILTSFNVLSHAIPYEITEISSSLYTYNNNKGHVVSELLILDTCMALKKNIS